MRRSLYLAVVAVFALDLLAACSAGSPANSPGTPGGSTAGLTGIHKIRHVIVIMQENRSFDSYFGTYPGADGIPMRNGVPTVCVPNPSGAASARTTTPLTSTAAAHTA